LLLCTPQANDIYIYIYIYIFRSIPKACHPIGVSSIFKKIQVLTSQFLAELDTPSFQHCWHKFKLHRWTSTVPIFHTFELFFYQKS
jgi:hypothetical protein